MKFNFTDLSDKKYEVSKNINLFEIKISSSNSNSLTGSIENDPNNIMKSTVEKRTNLGEKIIGELEIYSEKSIDFKVLKDFCMGKGASVLIYYISTVQNSMTSKPSSYLLRATLMVTPK